GRAARSGTGPREAGRRGEAAGGGPTEPATGVTPWPLTLTGVFVYSPDSLAAPAARDVRAARGARRMPSGDEDVVIAQRWLVVVARDRPRLYENLLESFRGNPLVAVIVDRREADADAAAAAPKAAAQGRRRRPVPPEPGRAVPQLGFLL